MSKFVRLIGMLALGFAALSTPSMACNEVISWYADLKSPAASTAAGQPGPAVGQPVAATAPSPESGRATFVFDFEHPQATVTVDTQGLQDVVKIELRARLTYGDLTGSPMAVLYDAKDGALPPSLTKTLTDADVIKVDKPKVASMNDVATVVLNGQAAVVVITKAHPDGEIAGRIGMHKTYVYSDDANSKFHDPKLHAAHLTSTPAPSQPATPTPSTSESSASSTSNNPSH